ncbi:hypothetical protein CAMSH0001_1218 [Campylobacter showae RM3277]|uniref:Uncharacterized protein n=1 Tax=Campylobacter showae RM3277 TaxID=553219 RepID=C6RDR1_9BACT|nr:hypothetical protein CAMSH0001_1218 [Campylobacter showae RM3277]
MCSILGDKFDNKRSPSLRFIGCDQSGIKFALPFFCVFGDNRQI